MEAKQKPWTLKKNKIDILKLISSNWTKFKKKANVFFVVNLYESLLMQQSEIEKPMMKLWCSFSFNFRKNLGNLNYQFSE